MGHSALRCVCQFVFKVSPALRAPASEAGSDFWHLLWSLLYPQDELSRYPREAFIADLVGEAERDIRKCLEGGATCVQIDFTEGRLSLKLDLPLQVVC